MSQRVRVAVLLIVSAFVAAGCGANVANTGAHPNVTKPPYVYVSIGGSESLDIASRSAIRNSWPQLFYSKSIGTAGTFYDLAQRNETAASAAANDVSEVRSLHPKLVTIWLSTADLLKTTPVGSFEQSLRALTSAIYGTGAKILLANAPDIERLPLYQACVDDPRDCGEKGVTLPTAGQLAIEVTAYNKAIAAVAATYSAKVVDVGTPLLNALSDAAGVNSLSTNFAALSAGAASGVASAFANDLPNGIKSQ